MTTKTPNVAKAFSIECNSVLLPTRNLHNLLIDQSTYKQGFGMGNKSKLIPTDEMFASTTISKLAFFCRAKCKY